MTEIITDKSIFQEPAQPLILLKQDNSLNEDQGREIVQALEQTITEKQLPALNAKQLGYNKRIFSIRFNDTVKTFINPVITKKSKMQIIAETNSSFPGEEFVLCRPQEITVVYYTKDFKYEENKLLGAAAALFDQQYQLLDGILPHELALVSNIETDGCVADLADSQFQQVKELYKQLIQVKLGKMQQTIQTDQTIHQTYRQLKFTQDVINGRTQVVVDEARPKPDPIASNRAKKQEKAASLRKFLQHKEG